MVSANVLLSPLARPVHWEYKEGPFVGVVSAFEPVHPKVKKTIPADEWFCFFIVEITCSKCKPNQTLPYNKSCYLPLYGGGFDLVFIHFGQFLFQKVETQACVFWLLLLYKMHFIVHKIWAKKPLTADKQIFDFWKNCLPLGLELLPVWSKQQIHIYITGILKHCICY